MAFFCARLRNVAKNYQFSDIIMWKLGAPPTKAMIKAIRPNYPLQPLHDCKPSSSQLASLLALLLHWLPWGLGLCLWLCAVGIAPAATSPFAGSYSASFAGGRLNPSGSVSGTLALQIDAAGNARAVLQGFYSKAMTGTVASDGTVSLSYAPPNVPSPSDSEPYPASLWGQFKIYQGKVVGKGNWYVGYSSYALGSGEWSLGTWPPNPFASTYAGTYKGTFPSDFHNGTSGHYPIAGKVSMVLDASGDITAMFSGIFGAPIAGKVADNGTCYGFATVPSGNSSAETASFSGSFKLVNGVLQGDGEWSVGSMTSPYDNYGGGTWHVQGASLPTLTLKSIPQKVKAWSDEFTYLIQVTNPNSTPLEQVVVVDNLPANVYVVDATTNRGAFTTKTHSRVTCNVGTLPAKNSVTITLSVVAKGQASTTGPIVGTFDLANNASVNVGGAEVTSATITTTVTNSELSGSIWFKRYPDSKSLDSLAEPFKTNAKAFFAALAKAKTLAGQPMPIIPTINTTLRPAERAYLMHYAFCIVSDDPKYHLDPRAIPGKDGVLISWVHRTANGQFDLAASKAAAASMLKLYQVNTLPGPSNNKPGVVAPSLTSNHINGLAIDMNFTWRQSFQIQRPNGTWAIIDTLPRDGGSKAVLEGTLITANGNAQLNAVGALYHVIKWVLGPSQPRHTTLDPPHWSYNGN